MTRHVVPSGEVYHLWANQVQDSAHNNGGTVSFDGDTAYSYGTPIGLRVVNARGEIGFLVSGRNYSVTTTHHQGMMLSAIGYETPNVFSVEYVAHGGRSDSYRFGSGRDLTSHHERIRHYSESIIALEGKAKRARKYRDSYLDQAAELRADLLAYCRFFDADMPDVDIDSLVRDVAAQVAADAEAAAIREVQAVAAAKQREARIRAETATEAQEWRDGMKRYPPAEYPDVLLRVRAISLSDYPPLEFDAAGNEIRRDVPREVETSLGAFVPLRHAERAYRMWQRGELAAGERVGHYHVSHVIAGDGVRIGCHTIQREEIELFAARMGWTEVSSGNIAALVEEA